MCLYFHKWILIIFLKKELANGDELAMLGVHWNGCPVINFNHFADSCAWEQWDFATEAILMDNV